MFGFLFPVGPISRADFARLVAKVAGFLSGLAVAQLDAGGRHDWGRASELALAAAAIVCVAMVLHVVAYVSTDRREITSACAHAAVYALVGAGIGSLAFETVSLTVLAGGAFLSSVLAMRACIRGGESNTVVAVAVSGVMGLVEVTMALVFVLHLIAALR